jgi:hypothetical protein
MYVYIYMDVRMYVYVYMDVCIYMWMYVCIVMRHHWGGGWGKGLDHPNINLRIHS